MISIMILYIYGFVLDAFEVTYLVSFIGFFDGTRDCVNGPCVDFTI